MPAGTDEPSDLDLEEIADALVDAPITLGVVFGSHARDEADRKSDVDVGVAFEETLSSHERTRARLSLIERLSSALGTDAVDVTPLDGAPPALLESIRRDGIVVYGDEDDLERRAATASHRTTERDSATFDETLRRLERVV